MNQVIIEAINTKHLLRVEYHGYYRLVEPYTYGINQKGNEALSCYQIAGGSESNEPQGWKLLLISEAHAISITENITENKFMYARTGYKPNTNTMKRIYAQL